MFAPILTLYEAKKFLTINEIAKTTKGAKSYSIIFCLNDKRREKISAQNDIYQPSDRSSSVFIQRKNKI